MQSTFQRQRCRQIKAASFYHPFERMGGERITGVIRQAKVTLRCQLNRRFQLTQLIAGHGLQTRNLDLAVGFDGL